MLFSDYSKNSHYLVFPVRFDSFYIIFIINTFTTIVHTLIWPFTIYLYFLVSTFSPPNELSNSSHIWAKKKRLSKNNNRRLFFFIARKIKSPFNSFPHSLGRIPKPLLLHCLYLLWPILIPITVWPCRISFKLFCVTSIRKRCQAQISH